VTIRLIGKEGPLTDLATFSDLPLVGIWKQHFSYGTYISGIIRAVRFVNIYNVSVL